ncbi:NfeD family protein [Ruegeria arenilitoris]|uniref:NfeD family protein n=1 Tax=Ruegeria arenilitoris TaxID=1173585 RepID=UPI00148026D4|nr:hypothetical protein [Ruegeria arenilitoris]
MADPFWLTWWIWIAAAISLAILEVFLPGFIFLGFAVGGAATGILLLISGMTPTLPVLLLIFAALSLIVWLVLRRMFAMPHGQVKTFDHDINE